MAHNCQRHHTPLLSHPNRYQPIPNPAAFTTIMSTILWLLMTGFLTPLPIYIHIHQYRHTHSDIVTIIYPQWLHSPPFSLSDVPNSSWYYGQHHGTSRHSMKIKISPNYYETHQYADSYAHYLGSSVRHCS